MPRGFSRGPRGVRLTHWLQPGGRADQRPFISSDEREDQEPRASQEDPERRQVRRQRRKEQRR